MSNTAELDLISNRVRNLRDEKTRLLEKQRALSLQIEQIRKDLEALGVSDFTPEAIQANLDTLRATVKELTESINTNLAAAEKCIEDLGTSI